MVEKSKGLNASESILAELGEKSFLTLWSYPNLSRSKGTELCDLLVVFDNKVLIFSDKLCSFNKSIDSDLAWSRWKRKAIDQSIKSVRGTERWIKEHPNSIFLDAACTKRFPFNLGRPDLTFYKFVIANGAPRDFFVNYYSQELLKEGKPFELHLSIESIVHVLNQHNLHVILKELDTITDFCDYFCEKERIINERSRFSYPSETDLLAHYFLKINGQPEHHKIHFHTDTDGQEYIKAGAWTEFSTAIQYQLKKEEDELSYLWDELLQFTANHTLNNTMEFSNSDPYLGKSALHVMAKEPRFTRRILAKNIQEAVLDFPPECGMRHVRRMHGFSDVLYVFLQLSPHENVDSGSLEYRSMRRKLLIVACVTLKIKIDSEQDVRFLGIKKIIGIAMVPPKLSGETNSQDFLLLNIDDEDSELEADCVRENEVYKFWKQATLKESEIRDEREFPDVSGMEFIIGK